MSESVAIPRDLLRDLYEALAKVEEDLVTIEDLMDEEGLERIRKAEEEYLKGEYIKVKSGCEIEKQVSEY